MQEFISKYQDRILGVLSGFDRVIFRGSLRRLNYGWWDGKLQARVALGMEEYLGQNHVLFKDYREPVRKVSEAIKVRSTRPFREKGLPVEFVRSPKVDKDEMARGIAQPHGIASGPVCVLAAMELTPTFAHRGTHMVMDVRPCQVLYHYRIHPEVGWMHARIQTWFPFHVQVGIDGREWLARQMQRAGWVSAGGELFCVAGGLRTGPATDESAVGNELGGVVGCGGAELESAARGDFCAL